MKIEVRNIQFIPIKPQFGLVGFASCEVDNKFYLGNLGVYTNLGNPGAYRLTYPCKKLPNGKLVKIFTPLSEQINEIITKAINQKVSLLMNPKTKGGEKNG
jgi:stage V sporulation protein G